MWPACHRCELEDGLDETRMPTYEHRDLSIGQLEAGKYTTNLCWPVNISVYTHTVDQRRNEALPGERPDEAVSPVISAGP